jgi:hypothetical protein
MPNPTLQHWRWRNDDGDEAGATWLAAADTAPAVALDTTYRLRFAVYQASGSKTSGYQLEYQVAHGGTITPWTTVDAASDKVRTFGTANLTDGDPTTRQLLSGYGYRPFNQQIDDVNGRTANVTLTAGEGVDIEYAFQVRSASVALGSIVRLRLIDTATGAVLSGAFTDAWATTSGGTIYLTFTDHLGIGEAFGSVSDVVVADHLDVAEQMVLYIPPIYYMTLADHLSIGETVTVQDMPQPPYTSRGGTATFYGAEGETAPLFDTEGSTE